MSFGRRCERKGDGAAVGFQLDKRFAVPRPVDEWTIERVTK
jgi:hypothetical protein